MPVINQHKIRLSDIDAPERGQPYGTVSGDHLGKLVFGKQGAVEYEKRDRYDRAVGKVLVNRLDANKAGSGGACMALKGVSGRTGRRISSVCRR
jgi:Staphylococcal nuclease homologue